MPILTFQNSLNYMYLVTILDPETKQAEPEITQDLSQVLWWEGFLPVCTSVVEQHTPWDKNKLLFLLMSFNLR